MSGSDPAGDGETTHPGPEGGEGAPTGPGPWRSELLAALEIAGLTGLAFARPVLDSFGRAPETFLVRDAGPLDVVLFALAVAVIPVLLVAAAGAATRPLGPRVRRWVHLGLVGILGAVVIWRFGRDATGQGFVLLAVAGALGGTLLVLARRHVPSSATFLRLLGAATTVFVLQFLVFSPAADIVTGSGGSVVSADAQRAVADGTDGDTPPIVMVTIDAVPTMSLLDGTGHIDPELYPNIAALAGGGTWYRNHTTVSAWTYEALPALLTGTLPRASRPLPDAGAYPDNLFTLLGGTYEVHAVEQLTRLCPSEVCVEEKDSGVLPRLLGDAVDWWRGALDSHGGAGTARVLPGALEPDRGNEFTTWIDQQDFSSDQPGLWYYHLLMPHDPWDVLDDGSPYAEVGDEPWGKAFAQWSGTGAEVGLQRQVLQTQAVDRALGQLFAEMRDAGIYDDALIVLVSDHGEAFLDGAPTRGMTPAQYEQVAWTPLIIKAPGQRDGVIDDANVWSIDVLPTVADLLGIELPWEVDGIPARTAADARRPDDKQVVDNEQHEIQPEDGGRMLALDAREGFERVLAADPVPGRGELAVWRRTRSGALVGRDLGELDVGGETAATRGQTIAVEGLDRLEHRSDGPPLLEFVGYSSLPPDALVALTVNGTVAAVTAAEPGYYGMQSSVHALLLPETFDTDNEIGAYLVTGEPGAETLNPVAVTAR